MNYKNLLQEYYQKQGPNQPFPTYKLIKDELQPDNSHIFTTELILPSTSSQYIGTGNTKKESQQNAAEKAYTDICNMVSSPIQQLDVDTLPNYVTPDEIEQVVLIDIENMPQALPPQHQYPPNTHIIGFISIYSPHYKKRQRIQPYCDLRIIDSAVKDSADVALIYECGRITATSSPKIVIITSDHYAEPLLQLIQQTIPDENHMKITCVSNLCQI
jgi:hypothetical protein